MTLRDFGLDMSWLINFSAGKTQLFSFGWPNITSGIDVKVDEFVHEEKSSFKMLGCLSLVS